MPRLLTLLTLLTAAVLTMAAAPHASESAGHAETLTYDVTYKWGIINKKAGSATLTLHRNGDQYVSRLSAASEPWADRFYRVRDTLNGRMDAQSWQPLFYEKIANEGNERKHDVVRYDYGTEGMVNAQCTRKVFKRNELKIDEERTMSAEGRALDMLTSFYFMRRLPFDTMTPGETCKIDIFSGKQKELLTIRYVGVDIVTVNDRNVPAYHVTFTFTSKGGTKSSDDMDAWIGHNEARTPLRLEGKLPVGKVKCHLTSPYNPE